MKTILSIAGLAGLLLTGSASLASAQGFNVQLGGDRFDRTDSVEERRVVRRGRDVEEFEERGPRRGVVEERIIRRDRPARTVCRTEIRERVTPGGVVIRRPTEVCRQVVGRRVIVD